MAAMVLLASNMVAEVIPAADSRVTFVGRTLVENGDVSFDWTGVYFRIAFTGKSLSMCASDIKWDTTTEMAATRHNY